MKWFSKLGFRWFEGVSLSLLATLTSLSLLALADRAEAGPNNVRIEIGGLGYGSPANNFDLPLNTPLVANQVYKVLIRAWDNDTDGVATRVHNFTFNISILNGTRNSFSWSAVGDANNHAAVNDSNFTNSLNVTSCNYNYHSEPPTCDPIGAQYALDVSGQVSSDIFALPTNTFCQPIVPGVPCPPAAANIFLGHELQSASKLSVGVLYFTAGANPSQLSINFDSAPYVSGDGFDRSHYSVDGVAYKINQGHGLKFPGRRYHPADVNGDGQISATESVNYTIAFKGQQPWDSPGQGSYAGAPNPSNSPELWPLYWIKSRTLFHQGASYVPNPNYNCGDPDPSPDNCWVIGQ